MVNRPYNVLFLCTGNSARSVLAESLLNHHGRGKFRAYSAGSFPKGEVNPLALELLRRLDLPAEGLRSKSWDEFAQPGAPELDFIITVCDNAAGEVCPIWPGHPVTAHWGLPDPAAVEGTRRKDRSRFAKRCGRWRTESSHSSSCPLRRLTASRCRNTCGRSAGCRVRMASESLSRRLVAEGFGSAMLAAAVIGSGIAAERLTDDDAVALLANTGATVAVLAVLISLLAPLSGAHFNPAVSLVLTLCRRLSWRDFAAYAVVQVAGCCLGAVLAHAMFELPLIQISSHGRAGTAQWIAEVIATLGLLLVVLGHRRPDDAPWMIAGWIGAAYWFTSSTSFANPAITLARSLTDTFAGIRPADALPFIGAQIAGALLALLLSRVLFPEVTRAPCENPTGRSSR